MSNNIVGSIEEFKREHTGRKLSPDEYAAARNAIKEAEAALENIELQTGEDYILFKWGTLKGWNLHSEKALELLKRYEEIGMSMSAMAQHDTTEQKEILCQLIDECDGSLQSDWTGEYFTKQQAKDYVMEYGD